jgi:hypothetical protein
MTVSSSQSLSIDQQSPLRSPFLVLLNAYARGLVLVDVLVQANVHYALTKRLRDIICL